MAQSKSFFGLRKGSTKSLTFSVYNGKQVTKDRLTEVKNPRSSLQMVQRAYMATAMRAYSALKEICDHSYEGIAYGQKSMNYFVYENTRMLRSAAPNVNLSIFKGNSVCNAYIISKGTLPPIAVNVNENFTIPMNGIEDGTTFDKVMAKLGATKIGDMVTFVSLINNPGGNASIYWIRLKLTSENSGEHIQATNQRNILEDLIEGTDFETNIDNFSPSDFRISFSGELNNKVMTIQLKSNSQNCSLGVILSRKSDTGWLRSSSTMVNLTNTFNFDKALATYPAIEEPILNGGKV